MTDPLKVGDRVLVSAHGQERVEATVVFASPNGESLMLEFPGGLFRMVDGGAYIGYMAVLWQDDHWIEILNGRTVEVERETLQA